MTTKEQAELLLQQSDVLAKVVEQRLAFLKAQYNAGIQQLRLELLEMQEKLYGLQDELEGIASADESWEERAKKSLP